MDWPGPSHTDVVGAARQQALKALRSIPGIGTLNAAALLVVNEHFPQLPARRYDYAQYPGAPISDAASSTRTSTREAHSRMKVKGLIDRLEEDGWKQVRMRGSHRQFRHSMKPGTVTVAGNPSLDVPPGTLNAILKQAGLT